MNYTSPTKKKNFHSTQQVKKKNNIDGYLEKYTCINGFKSGDKLYNLLFNDLNCINY